LDFSNIPVAPIFNLLKKGHERVEFEFLLLELLGQVQNKQFFDFEFLLGFACLSRCLGCSPGHLFANSRQELNLFLALLHGLVKHLHLLFALVNFVFKRSDLGFGALVLDAFLDQLANEDLLLFLQVVLSLFVPVFVFG